MGDDDRKAEPEEDSHCRICSASIPADASYCPKCGKEVVQEPVQGADDNQPEQPWADRVFEGGEKGMWGCIALIAVPIVGAVLLVGQCARNAATEAVTPQPIDPVVAQRNEAVEARIVAESNLRAGLKDSESARLQGLFVSRYGKSLYALCGKLNAKNSFGAYTGFKDFVASPNTSIPPLIQDEAVGLYQGLSKADFRTAQQRFCGNPVLQD